MKEKGNHAINEKPLISVCIPLYDRTTMLQESITSILKQTYENFELLLVCDGSPPDTLQIIETYKSHPKIKIFKYKNNSGTAVRGRNRAIKEAQGEYFAFHDSDDIAECNRLERSVTYMKRYNVDVVYGSWRALVEEDMGRGIKHNQVITCSDCNYEMLKTFCYLCQSTVMVKTEALKKVGGLKSVMRYREDHELWLRLAYHGYRFKSIPDVLTNLRLHHDNLEFTFKADDKKWFHMMQREHKCINRLRPKIAYVIPTCELYGGILVVCQHANELLKRGYDVLLLTTDDSREMTWFPNQRVKILSVSECPLDIDILIATFWTTAYHIHSLPAKRKIYFIQANESQFYEEGSINFVLARKTYQLHYEHMTISRWIQTWLKEEHGSQAYYVPNGLPTESFCIPNHAGKKVRVLLEGAIDVTLKGMEEAFLAVKDLNCEIWCVSSDGKPHSNWRCNVFLGKVPMEQMKNIYSRCDILLKLSKVESFGLPPLEMMACGGACVVSDVSGHREYVIDGYNALVVEPGNMKAAQTAVKKLIEDDTLRATLSRNGMETAKKWTLERTVDLLEDVITEGSAVHFFKPYAEEGKL